jgi:hypothetical protein
MNEEYISVILVGIDEYISVIIKLRNVPYFPIVSPMVM